MYIFLDLDHEMPLNKITWDKSDTQSPWSYRELERDRVLWVLILISYGLLALMHHLKRSRLGLMCDDDTLGEYSS